MRDELRRQLRRRRTRVLLATMVVVPLLLVAAYVVRGAPEVPPGATPQLEHLAGTSGFAFAVFVLYLCAPLLLLAAAAAFAGDSLASESTWGTLRYLRAAPVPRRRLLARNLAASLALGALATALLVGTALVAGTLAFGAGPLDTPVGGELAPAAASIRIALASGYAFITVVPFAALALLFATLLDTPLAAVGAAVGIALVSQVLDVVESLGSLRAILPTHYALAWTDLFVDPPVPGEVAAGVLQASAYAVVACVLAWWRFSRRDILG